MKRWFLTLFFALLLTVPALAEGGSYTPSTELEARCVPVSVPIVKSDGTTHWYTLYNPETADMCVELASASTTIGASDKWKTIMGKYGYEQLYCTEDNKVYADGKYPLGLEIIDGQQSQLDFPAVNALAGIQKVVYNGQTRYAVGLVFRGTHDAQDLRADLTAIRDEEGFHKGFSLNATEFYETMCDIIAFTVEGQHLTLTEILTEMKTPNSRFCMLVMGHSLGGALANVVVGRDFYRLGVHPSNLAAYALATPRSAPSNYEYPYHNVYNILSADDPITQVTLAGNTHIGKTIVFRPTDGFRALHYGDIALEHVGEPAYWWQTTGSILSGLKTHFIATSYRPLVKLVSEEIRNSSMDSPSQYSSFSTSGHNVWLSGSAIIGPNTFGSLESSLNSGGTLRFEGGVLQVKGDCQLSGGITMHREDDYLLLESGLQIVGSCPQEEHHLTAGTVELKGDFTADVYSGNAYHTSGTHRTIFSGRDLQTVKAPADERHQYANLCLRNRLVDFRSAVSYLRLAEDAVFSETASLVVNQNLDLNGFSLIQNGAMSIQTLDMGGGDLRVTGDLKLHTPGQVDGSIHTEGDLTCVMTLPFAGGQVHVGGSCELSRNLLMRSPEDFLFVGGDLTLRSNETIPADHLSAGTVELQGDLMDDIRGANSYYIYHETGTHRTIFSGTGSQLVWFKTMGEQTVLQPCLRNPLTELGMVYNVRLMEDGALAHPEKCKIQGTLDLNGHKLAAQGSFAILKNLTGGSGLIRMTVDPDSQMVTVNRAEGSADPIHILFTGYDSDGRLVIYQAMTFDSKEEMDSTLQMKNWPECTTIRVFLLEDDYIPFCGSIGIAGGTIL